MKAEDYYTHTNHALAYLVIGTLKLNCSYQLITHVLGDIPSYTTKPAHVTRISSVTKRDTDDDALYYMIQTTDEILNITLYPNKKLLSRQ